MKPTLSFDVEDSGSEPGTVHNDDCWGSVATAVWILDGATGLSKKRLLPSASTDAQWFVRAVDIELRNADWSEPTETLLRSALQRVNGRFRNEARGTLEQALWPFASFALIRALNDHIEFVNLGDCRILWKRRDFGGVKSFGSSRVTELDSNVVNEIKRLHRGGTINNEVVWEIISPIIQANRDLKNRPGGYWILDIAGDGLGHLQKMELDPSDIDKVLLCTDGYYRLVDTYLTRTVDSLLEDSMGLGIAGTIRSIREIERADDRCLSFPRIKSSDDATGVLVVVRRGQ
jgi:serine/threonine protein phosphatase PrpC